MNGEYLYEAIGGISPAYVDEAEKQRFSKPLWRTLAPVAACAAVILGMYAGFRTLQYGLPAPEIGALIPSASGSPAAQAAAEHFRGSPWFNWGSLLLGLTAWILPIIGLIKKQHKQALTLGSFAACTLSLLLQICNVLHRVNSGDFSTLNDTMWFVLLAAAVLVTGTAVVHLITWAVSLREKQ